MEKKQFKYKVDVAEQRSGGLKTVDYVTGWSPDKVSLESVAQACAAELTVSEKVQYFPVNAILLGAVA